MQATALNELRRLIADPGSDPLVLAEALARTREACAADAATRWQLDRLELAFLQQRALLAQATPALVRAADQARLAEIGVETRIAVARPDDDPVALFDLAEQCAAYRLAERRDDLARARAEIARRRVAVTLDERTVEEAHERYAALITEEEDLSLAHKVCLLEECGAVFDALAEKATALTAGRPASAATDTRADSDRARRGTADRNRRDLRRMAARVRRMACDRVLTQRLERLLSKPGARALELTSLFLLLAVFGILLLETWRDWSPATEHAFRMADGAICLFFIAEFGLKLALAPARTSWFLRHVLTDLLPAIPAALVFASVQVPDTAGDAVFVRLLRLMRVTYFARYIQALQPLLRLLRLLLFLVKGMDGLVRRFSPLLNRNFVFFERMSVHQPKPDAFDPRETLFRALRREHVLLEEAGLDARVALEQRAQALCARLEATGANADAPRPRRTLQRDIPVETAINDLYALRVDELNQYLSDKDLRAVDRVVRVISAPVVRSLPIIGRFAVRDPNARTPATRVVALSTNIALYLERWRTRMVLYADLHGIITGPQMLDRVASAMMKASQRPAVRLLLWGGLFFLVRLIVGAKSGPGQFLQKFVAGPLVVFGSVCVVFLSLGWWLKRLAGEASETFKLTSEAQFIALLELLKSRREHVDAEFLARRVFRWELPQQPAAEALRAQAGAAREGVPATVPEPRLEAQLHRVSLLHLHYLDGGPLHASDIRTTEQLLANLSLDNVRAQYLGWSRKDKKRIKQLSLSDGSVFRGPYMWFSFITESIAVETAKRITDYNRHCLTTAQQAMANPAVLADFKDWLERRRNDRSGRRRTKTTPPGRGDGYTNTEFCALDFLSGTKERDDYIGRMFGPTVLEVLRIDRRRMVREVFGMRPMHRLPRAQRSINFANFYRTRLSGGRILLLPVYLAIGFFSGISAGIRKLASTVREIVAPHKAARGRVSGRAPFAVALRKIHRMKAPGLLEAMRLRASFDPEYCGAPATRGPEATFAERSELTLDMHFLHLSEREQEEFAAIEASMRKRIEQWQRAAPATPRVGADVLERGLRDRAQAIAWVADKDWVRTLWTGGEWLRNTLARLGEPGTKVAASRWRVLLGGLRRRRHPVEVLLREHFDELTLSPHARRNLHRLWHAGDAELVELVAASHSVPAGVDWRTEAAARLDALDRDYETVNRDLAVVRAVQSLTVLDVRNYREMVFELGDYASDGEDAAAAKALP